MVYEFDDSVGTADSSIIDRVRAGVDVTADNTAQCSM
jgi:hypothetical protein